MFIISIHVYAEDDISLCCGTDPEFIQETHKALVQKKQAEINQETNPWDNSITLYSKIPSVGTLNLMPSTGDVRALVVTVSFPNAPISEERFEKLEDQIYGVHSDADVKSAIMCDNQII